MASSIDKRQSGRFYTEGNPFIASPFLSWVQKNGLNSEEVLEPFAGKNNLVRALRQVGLAEAFSSFDIQPTDNEVAYRDTLKDFPTGFGFCVTNPPWLARNSAKRRSLLFPETEFDDLYKHAVDICLKNCEHVAAIIPATFLQSGLFRDRLSTVIFLHDQSMFVDTENPVCLALFNESSKRVEVFNDDHRIGFLDELEMELPPKSDFDVTFNDPQGDLGLIAFDDTRGPSIRFVDGQELSSYKICVSSRMITRIGLRVDDVGRLIQTLNEDLRSFRKSTCDVFLTPFKGLRKDGYYRRRMDYRLARDFIAKHANSYTRL